MKGTKPYAVLAAMLIAMLVLSACGATATPAPAPTAAPTAEPTAVPPTEEPAAEAPDAGALAANLWQWTSFTSPVERFEVEMPESYLLAFNEDGTVNIVADCNNAMGSYTDDAGSLSIEVGPMTMAACPPESRSDQFVLLLGSAVRYYFADGMLYVDLEADGGTMAFAPADAELMAAEAPEAGALTANPWQWVSFTGPMEQFDVEMPESYLVAFSGDGTVNIVADCNNAMGSYTDDAGSLTIEVGPMTMAACPPDSRSDQFVALLGSVVRYYFEDAQLYIDLLADGGTMVFAPEGEAEMGGDGQLPDELVAQLDAWLNSQVYAEGGDPEGAAPGLVLLADTPEGRYLSAAGVSSLEEMTPMQANDILEIGSNTKSMTVVLLMQLQEEGVLSLDDMLSDWLPDLAAQIPNGNQITLRQMAQHTAGLWDYGDPIIGEAATNPDKLELGYTPEELVQYALDNGTPDFAPGEEGKWHYSNTGYVLLGMIAEKASGKSLGELYQEQIFDPLGMETAVLIEGVPREGEITTQGYWWLEDGKVLNTTNWNASQGWAAGAVAMTAEDLAVYGKALAAGELFQNEDSLAQMLAFDEDALYVVGGPYGLGLIDFGNGYWGHEGQTAGFQTLWYTNPDEQITVVGLTNSAAYHGFAFLNVLNILEGEGAKPFTAGTLLPVGNLLSSKWAWVQLVEPSGTSDIAPGTVLTLAKDGTAIAKGEGCGTAIGPFTSDASSQISFELDTSLLTCDDQAPVTQLVSLLGGAGTWHFDNGRLLISLDDDGTLLFEVDKSEG